jgi:hypothetical protein
MSACFMHQPPLQFNSGGRNDMKLNHLLAASLAGLVSEVALAQVRVGTPTAPVPWDDTGLLAIAAGGLAFGIWLVRRKKDK